MSNLGGEALGQRNHPEDRAHVNGIVAPPLLVMVMLAARNKKVMGKQTIGPLLTTLGWIATLGMFLALAGLAYTTITGSGG